MAEKISRFFSDRLHASLSNERWSWGAYDASANRLFLRVWQHGLSPDGKTVEILWDDDPRTDAGANERRRHVDLMSKGVEAYGVLCLRDESSEKTRIKSFDSEILLTLGKPKPDGKRTVAPILGRQVLSLLSVARDWDSAEESAIWNDESLTETERVNLVAARIGQGLYRRRILERWDYGCAVTGCDLLFAVKASHAKPWKRSSNKERLDPENGLPLIATLDALFDRGLIAFSHTGEMVVSNRIDERQRLLVGIPRPLRKRPSKRCADYLQWHITEKFVR